MQQNAEYSDQSKGSREGEDDDSYEPEQQHYQNEEAKVEEEEQQPQDQYQESKVSESIPSTKDTEKKESIMSWLEPVKLYQTKKSVKYRQIKNTAVTSKGKKFKPSKFVINTRHCRSEKETVQYVADLNRWEESKVYADGNMIWYGQALRDQDIDVVRSRPKVYINRYPGSELLTRKKILCNIMNRMEKYFGRDFEYTPLSYLLPEERELLEEDMENNPD